MRGVASGGSGDAGSNRSDHDGRTNRRTPEQATEAGVGDRCLLRSFSNKPVCCSARGITFNGSWRQKTERAHGRRVGALVWLLEERRRMYAGDRCRLACVPSQAGRTTRRSLVKAAVAPTNRALHSTRHQLHCHCHCQPHSCRDERSRPLCPTNSLHNRFCLLSVLPLLRPSALRSLSPAAEPLRTFTPCRVEAVL